MTSTATAPPFAGGASMLSPSPSSARLASGGKVAPTSATSMRCVNWSQQVRAVPDRTSNSCPSCRFATRSCSFSPWSSSASFSSLPRSAAGDYSPHGSEVHRAIILVRAGAKSRGQCRRRRRIRCAISSVDDTYSSSSSSSVTADAPLSLGGITVKDFPILSQEVNGRRIVYLDNAATSQKPREVIDAVQRYYEEYNSNVHRGIHTLSVKATEAYEEARGKLARFINAEMESEVIYTRNATEAINLVANSWGLPNLTAGDEVVLSVMEHHSNLVPWQIVAQKTGAVLRFVSLSQCESLDMDHLRSLVGNKTKLVALQHVSNALGCVNDAVMIGEIAHKYGAKVLLDGCQSVPHMPVDVRALNCDWFVGSGHKMCGPTGIGFLYGKMEVLKSMPPFLGGGEMIQDVYLDHSTYADPPNRFEAGTPAIGEAIGLGAACDYLMRIGMDKIHDYEVELSEYLYEKMTEVEGLKIYGPKPTDPGGRAGLCSFNVGDIHPTDLSMILDQSGFAIRSGHHCAQPLHRHFGINASARASLYFYNTKEEIDLFIEGLKETIQFFSMPGAP